MKWLIAVFVLVALLLVATQVSLARVQTTRGPWIEAMVDDAKLGTSIVVKAKLHKGITDGEDDLVINAVYQAQLRLGEKAKAMCNCGDKEKVAMLRLALLGKVKVRVSATKPGWVIPDAILEVK